MESIAKRYATLKYTFSLTGTLYLLLLLFVFQQFGFSFTLSRFLSKTLTHQFFVIPAYVLIVMVGYYLLEFPLNVCQTFVLERTFNLSNQQFKDWLKDQLKTGLIGYLIAIILASAFYFIMKRFLHSWWLVVSLFWIFFSLVLAKLTPLVIIPLFFKYKQLGDEALKKRIIALAKAMKVRILDVFEIDFSKKTLKANAAFVGWGKSRRVLLADTLKDKYTHDEVGVILAHEFAHYQCGHLIKLISINSLVIILSFYLVYATSGSVLIFFGLDSLWDIATLPIVMMYFVVIGFMLQPFENYISRIFERSADLRALEVTGLKDAFVSMMNKLGNQNLADRNPHPLIKLFFFDHPPIDERISFAQSYKGR